MIGQVYCLNCSSVVSEREAGTIFRTGYYKVTIRLGFCLACSGPTGMEAAAAAAAIDDMREQPEGEGGLIY